MNSSKKDILWKKIFSKHKILEKVSSNGTTSITSAEINLFSEARLMTKFDHFSQLPKLFIDNNLSILPISRGDYLIGTFNVFHRFDSFETPTRKINFPTFLESLDRKNISSEAIAINCAFVTNLLHDFTGEETLFPTVNGRMSSSSFRFNINSTSGKTNVFVNNSQIEIDGGFEGSNSLVLIEAKNYISDDFLVRQLFYPYKLWSNKISKRIRPVFLSYSNGIFHLREFIFDDINHYNSLRLVNEMKYIIQGEPLNIETIQQALGSVKTIKEPEIPFPQADSFDRVVNLCELLKEKGSLTKEEITQNYDFDKRQTDYYTNAGKYLGLIETRRNFCSLTTKGIRVFSMSLYDRQLEFIRLILSHSIFKNTLRLYLDCGDVPLKSVIIEEMKRHKLFHIRTESTYHRRASTISGWINWILKQIEE